MGNDISQGSLLFQEKYAMAQSHKNWWTKSVNTWKCVMVNLSSQHLQVKLHGLFGLLVKPFGADIEHTIPLDRILTCEKKRKILGYDEIPVVFKLPDGNRRELRLYLKRGDEFLNLIKSMTGT